MTIRQFIFIQGGNERAAAQLGINPATLWRWLTGKSRPRGKAVCSLLKELNITVPRWKH
jgi:transcriptional regulator with XRE-family HTH domain